MYKIRKFHGKQQKQPTRFVIIPLKPYLAKFIQVDWKRIGPLISDEDLEYTREVWSRPKKLGRYYWPRIYEDEKYRERILFDGIKIMVCKYFKMEIPKSCTYKDFNVQVYKNRKNISKEWARFISEGHSLVKITFPVYNKVFPNKEEYSDRQTYTKNINNINELLVEHFYGYLIRKESGIRNYQTTISEVFEVLGLTENHISKETIRRNLSKRKTEFVQLFYYSLGKDSLHTRISNIELFEIYRDHIEHNLSYSQLSEKYNHHRSKISRICTNKKVIKLYEEVSFDHEKFQDWHSEKLSKLFSQNETE